MSRKTTEALRAGTQNDKKAIYSPFHQVLLQYQARKPVSIWEPTYFTALGSFTDHLCIE